MNGSDRLLDTLTLDNYFRVTSFQAKLCNYMENALTSHIHQHKLTCSYFANAALREQSAKMALPEWPTLLVKHETNEQYALSIQSAPDSFPLISVQAIVVFRRSGQWHFVSAYRTANAAVAPGRLQLQPAGGFEIFGRETDEWHLLTEQFALEHALIREFLEECAGDRDLTAQYEDAAKGHLSESTGFKRVKKMMDVDKRFHIHFLGVVVDLVFLRPEFSFVIVIENDAPIDLTYDLRTIEPGYVKTAQWLDHDSSEAIKLLPVRLAELSEWVKRPLVHHGSVGLAQLFCRQCQPGSFLAERYGLRV